MGALESFSHRGGRLTIFDRMEARFALWKATENTEHLREAHLLLCLVRENSPPQHRQTLVAEVPIHREIQEASERQTGS